MIKEMQIPVFQLVTSISSTTDLISPSIANHHKLVSYIAYRIADELGLSMKERKNILLAGALHDLGAFSLEDKLDIMEFEMKDPHKHADIGHRLLSLLGPFDDIATLIRFHHIAWDNGSGYEHDGCIVPEGGHIIHLADRIAVLINNQADPRDQAAMIIQKIGEFAGSEFKPELVEAFRSLATKEFFWLDIGHQLTSEHLQGLIRDETVAYDMTGLMRLAKFFAQLIDFRSPFTATHSSGVAASAVAIAKHMAFSEIECSQMQIAGYLHDLGKLAVPTEILEKPGKLTADEWKIMKAHTYHGYRALEPITDLQTINAWGSFHHERLDGNGYPFHLDRSSLTLGSRIMAVADVFTAITEDRPYRKGMDSGEAIKVIKQLAHSGALDINVAETLVKHFDSVNYGRIEAQSAAMADYKQFKDQ